jgi:ABC-2 type transport system permease protein
MTTDRAAGVIHDIGYQRYEGRRLGRSYAARSLYQHGVRTAFGLGRSAKAKVFPWIVVGIVGAVAIVVTAIRAQLGQPVLSYVAFPGAVSLLVVLFCAVVAPELVSRDLGTGVLPLYFSRPLARSDYVFAKLAALSTAAWLLLAGPQLLMFVGGAFSVQGFRAVWNEFLDLLPGLLFSAVYAVVFAALALLVAALTSRRAIAAVLIVATFVVTTPVVGVLSLVGGDTARHLAFLASPSTALSGIGAWLFGLETPDIGGYGPLYGVTVLAVTVWCVLLLLARYRRVAR